MSDYFHHKTILITGANGGFGQELIAQLLKRGGELLLTDLDAKKLQSSADKIQSELGEVPGKILDIIEADLSDPSSLEQIYQNIHRSIPFLDFLINNAGLSYLGLFHEVPEEKWEKLIAVNLLAPLRLTYRFLPEMLSRRSGHVVNISSLAGMAATSHISTYSVSKFGLRGFGESLAAELRGTGVHLTQIYPFFAKTPILNAADFGKQKISLPPPWFPDWCLYTPQQVVSTLLKGVSKKRVHIYPGLLTKLTVVVRGIAPWLLPRRMD